MIYLFYLDLEVKQQFEIVSESKHTRSKSNISTLNASNNKLNIDLKPKENLSAIAGKLNTYILRI